MVEVIDLKQCPHLLAEDATDRVSNHRARRRPSAVHPSLSAGLNNYFFDRLSPRRPCGESSVCTRSSIVSASSGRSAGTCASDFAALAIARILVQQFRLGYRLPDLRAAVVAFIGEVDLRHAPTRRDVPDVHRQPLTVWADYEGWFAVVMVDIGWHVGSPTRHSVVVPGSKTSISLCGCHNLDLYRTHRERPRIPSVCDKSARPPSASRAMRVMSEMRLFQCRAQYIASRHKLWTTTTFCLTVRTSLALQQFGALLNEFYSRISRQFPFIKNRRH